MLYTKYFSCIYIVFCIVILYKHEINYVISPLFDIEIIAYIRRV